MAGVELGSTCIEFQPGPLDPPDRLRVDVGTAGAVTLVLQALMVPLACSSKSVTIELTGGTHVAWSPTIEYFEHVFGYYLARMGCGLTVSIERAGFYPRGGGLVRAELRSGRLRAVDLTQRGRQLETLAWSVASEGLARAEVAQRQARALGGLFSLDRADVSYYRSSSPGSALSACAYFENAALGCCTLGERGKRAELVGRECGIALRRQLETGACLDEHMADQLLPYMALAPQDSSALVASITPHCRTNIWAIQSMLPVRFEVDSEAGLITCRHL
jgi:RNA 3'-phosphate cyclase